MPKENHMPDLSDTIISVDEHGDTNALVAALITRTSEMAASIERLERRLSAVQTSAENAEIEIDALKKRLSDIQQCFTEAASA